MARALQCPTCGTKTRLDGLTSDTFRCEQCGQVLKVPPAARSAASSAAASTAASPPPRRRRPAPTPTAAAEPPPRRVTPDSVVAAAGAAAALPPRGRPPVVSPPRTDGRGAAGQKIPRDALPLGVRIGAWVLAVPVGLAIVGVPAAILGYLTSQKLLDVFVKHTLARFVPLLIIVVLWALATTLLVEVFVEGGRWLMLRRRRRGGPGVGAPAEPRFDAGGTAPRVPPRQRRTARTRGS